MTVENGLAFEFIDVLCTPSAPYDAFDLMCMERAAGQAGIAFEDLGL